ncbi:uncharacterized protein PHALS_09970 [Plasmopara halstedii]|uniref:Reverse transcriptase RNase H-like domain-containing protein n=1 Tax=Plasmopara halstedii TaxID=4781 RepID=A0A0P1AGL7_PLAHL|nr:uncharacterized protein PHALS_09970 [Plasmopara halstedii]CEG39733.1 hypothetical protein PHALS_09970 [Plasmopara halstedii]|eukprot:XP_024576102.1 hypothetical protein PHALS_09970 [Plasmopara halstedii]
MDARAFVWAQIRCRLSPSGQYQRLRDKQNAFTGHLFTFRNFAKILLNSKGNLISKGRKVGTSNCLYWSEDETWELNYPELLATTHALNTLSVYLLDKLLLVDRQIVSIQETANRRVTRWFNDYTEFRSMYKWIPGERNVVADALSRIPPSSSKKLHKSVVRKFLIRPKLQNCGKHGSKQHDRRAVCKEVVIMEQGHAANYQEAYAREQGSALLAQ